MVTAQKRSLYGSNVSVHANETLTGIAAKELGKGATPMKILDRVRIPLKPGHHSGSYWARIPVEAESGATRWRT